MGPYGEDAEAILYTDINLEPRPARGDGWERVWNAEKDPAGRVTGH